MAKRQTQAGPKAKGSISVHMGTTRLESKAYFVNQFRVSKQEGMYHVNAGFNSGGQTLVSTMLVFPQLAIDATRDSVIQYMDRALAMSPTMVPAEQTTIMASLPEVF